MGILSGDRPKKASLIKIRFIIILITTFCPIVCYISRQNLSLAIVAMVQETDNEAEHSEILLNRTNSQKELDRNGTISIPSDSSINGETCPYRTTKNANGNEEQSGKIVNFGPKYNWTSSERSLIMESFFFTYVIFQIPAARFAEAIGAKWILATAGIGSFLLSLIAPWAASLHPWAFALVRALMGVCQTALYPACYVLYTKWLPPVERSQALPFLGAGAFIGSIITFMATGYFSEQESLGWEYAFYMPSAVCAIWSLLWIVIASSEPRENRFISLEEIDYIESKMETKIESSQSVKRSPSWKKIAKSQHIWAMVAAFLASNWAFTIVIMLLPSYLNYILHIPTFENAMLNSLLYGLVCISSPIVGAVSTLMVETRTFGMNRLQIRKLFQCTALFAQAIGFVMLTWLGCKTDTVLALLYTQVILFSFINGGEVQLPSDVSPEFAGTIYAIGNCVGSSTGFLVPRVHSLIVPHLGSAVEWNVYFYFAALVTLIGGLVFLIFGKNDPQDFSMDIDESKSDTYKMSSAKDHVVNRDVYPRKSSKTYDSVHDNKQKQLSI